MQVEFHWDSLAEVIRAQINGPANAQDYFDRFRQFLVDNPDLRTAPMLWDLRQLDFASFTPEEVTKLAELRRSLHEFRHDAKSAVLISSALEYIPMMFLKQTAEISDMPLEIFMEEREAMAWLRQSA